MWIENAAGQFVKSFGLWGRETNSNDFPIWNSKNGGVKSIDGVSAATLSSSQTLSTNWKCTNAAGTIVTEGTYYINIELTNRHSTMPNPGTYFVRTPIVIDREAKTKSTLDSSLNNGATYITSFLADYIPDNSTIESFGALTQLMVTPYGFVIPAGLASQVRSVRLFSIDGRLIWQDNLQNRTGSGIVITRNSYQQKVRASGINYLVADFGKNIVTHPVVSVK